MDFVQYVLLVLIMLFEIFREFFSFEKILLGEQLFAVY